jgi:hypothetical protein
MQPFWDIVVQILLILLKIVASALEIWGQLKKPKQKKPGQ